MLQTTPILPGERAAILDILRGFALLGIFLANSAVFSLYIMQKPDVIKGWPTAPVDEWLTWGHFVFIDGKFYSLFSLLFGIGFSIIFSRNKARGNNGLTIFYRRLFVLLLFGTAHSLLLWDGDILMFYALTGMFLPLFRNAPDKTLVLLAGVLLLLPLLFDAVKVWTNGRWDLSRPFLKAALARDQQTGITEDNVGNWLIVHKDYRNILDWGRSGFWWVWQMRISSNRPVKVLAMFLLGLYVGRSLIYARLEVYKPMLKRIQGFGLGLGIPAGLLHVWFEQDGKQLPAAAGLWDTWFYALNVAPLALGYAATIALWYVNGKYLRLLKPLCYMGRMALTNYIMQSVLGVFIYYGIGLGLGARSGPLVFMPIAAGVFFLQMWISRIWLRYFEYGPLEWIWRQLTYGKRLPFKAGKTGQDG